MKIIFDSKDKTILTVDMGEEFFTVINKFAKDRNTSFTFSVIGGCESVELAYYDLGSKKYITKEFKEEIIEIITMTGNAAWYEGKPLIHAHGVFSGKNYRCFGGHVMKIPISLTAEVVISWLNKKIEKEYDTETGLKFLCKNT